MHRPAVQGRLDTCWRVFYTSSRCEKKCEELLKRQQIDVFLPKRVVVSQWKDRKKRVQTPLFQNYIFAHVNENDRIRVLRTKGIVRCLAFNGKFASVSHEEIDQLKLLEKQPDHIEPYTKPLPPTGSPITIDKGPLQGLKGEVIEHRGSMSLVVEIPSIRQRVRVIVPAFQVA